MTLVNQMKNTDQTKKPDVPVKEKTVFPVWQKPKFPNSNKFIKQVRLPGSQHRG